MTTVTACSYGASSTSLTLYDYYAQDDAHKRMCDYLTGAASHFNIRPAAPLSVGVQEDGRVNGSDNWMQVGSGVATSFDNGFWSPNNGTGVSAPSYTQIKEIDSLNAAVGAWYLTSKTDCGYTDYRGLLAQFAGYNGVCCSCPYETAYAWSCLLRGWGDGYAIGSYTYGGRNYPTGPTGVTMGRYSNTGCPGSGSITVPTFAPTAAFRNTPYGRNSNNKQIMLLASDDVDYVSALQVCVNMYPTAYRQPMVLSDAGFAAAATQYTSDCVVMCVGGPAVTAINAVMPGLTSYASFSAWNFGSTRGYVDCAGATRLDTYNEANTQTSDASAAGY